MINILIFAFILSDTKNIAQKLTDINFCAHLNGRARICPSSIQCHLTLRVHFVANIANRTWVLETNLPGLERKSKHRENLHPEPKSKPLEANFWSNNRWPSRALESCDAPVRQAPLLARCQMAKMTSVCLFVFVLRNLEIASNPFIFSAIPVYCAFISSYRKIAAGCLEPFFSLCERANRRPKANSGQIACN